MRLNPYLVARLARKKKGSKHMTPTPLISVINQSTLVSDADVAKMTSAIGKQCALHVSPLYGHTPALEFVPRGTKPTPGGAPCYLIDQPDIDGALGYHDIDENGVPYIKIFAAPTLDNGGTALFGANSVSVTASHEVLELVGDEDANLWATGRDGFNYARELCDAVEADAYTIDGVAVSNFLYPAFFNPRAQPGSKLDYLAKLSIPFSMSPGGYQIREAAGAVDQVFAHEVEQGARHVPITDTVHLILAPGFPTWKVKYKERKAIARAAA